MDLKDVNFWDRLFVVGRSKGVPMKRMYKWRERGVVPAKVHYELEKEAEKLRVPLSREELITIVPAPATDRPSRGEPRRSWPSRPNNQEKER